MCDASNVPILIKKVVIEGSTITHLEKLGPRSSDNLNRAKGAQDKLPEELLIFGAALPHRAIAS